MALGSQTSGCCWSPATSRSDGSAPASPHSAPTCGHTACLSFSPGRRNGSSPQTSPRGNLWTISTQMCLSPCPELAAQGLAQSHSVSPQQDRQMGRRADGQSDRLLCLSRSPQLRKGSARPPNPGALDATQSFYPGGELIPMYNPEALPSYTVRSQPQAIRMSQPEGPPFGAQRG